MNPGDQPPENRYYNPSRRRNTDGPAHSPPTAPERTETFPFTHPQHTPTDDDHILNLYPPDLEGGTLPQPSTPGRLRTLTDIPGSILRGRAPPWNNNNLSSGDGGHSYSPLSNRDRDGSPSPATQGGIHLDIPSQGASRARAGSSPTSPGLDIGAFQAAMTGFGMEFGPELRGRTQGTRPIGTHARQISDPSTISQQSDGLSRRPSADGRLLDVPLMDDTAPIMGSAAPMAGVTISVSPAEPEPITITPNRPRAYSNMLGEDLANNMEAGTLSSHRSHSSGRRSISSGSPASTLKRGATILRQMSQRIVNVSNEQDVVERTLHQSASTHDLQHSQSQSHMMLQGGEETEMEMRPLPTNAVPISILTPATTPGQEDASSDYVGAYPRDGLPSITVEDEHTRLNPPPPYRPQPTYTTGWRSNPFKGYSLGIFPPDNWLRMKLCDILIWPWTENIILGLIFLQTIILAIDSNRPVTYNDVNSVRFGKYWTDFVLLGLFCIYTVELVAKIIVSGLILNDAEYSTVDRSLGWPRAILSKLRSIFTTPDQLDPHTINRSHNRNEVQDEEDLDEALPPPLIHSLTTAGHLEDILHGDNMQVQRKRLARRAFLRHSFDRLDFISVVAFWISFVLQLFNIESGHHAYVFRMMSCLRIMRLLRLTNGTSVILRSLKTATPLLLNVGFLICFFWLIFAIIGVQSFKSSLRRQCVWIDPQNSANNWTNPFQFCGGYLDPITYKPLPWLKADGTAGAGSAKGYFCPVQSVCKETQNPYNGSVSYDNILQSIQLVFVLMTTNTFTDLMYYLTNSDYLASALFSAVGVVILYFWLVNLLIAVITSTFQVIREGSKSSPFTGEKDTRVAEEDLVDPEPHVKRRRKRFKSIFKKTKWFWIAIISFGIVSMCLRSATMGPDRSEFINIAEKCVTFLLLIEIILRALVDVIDGRNFFRSKANVVDLAIAIITSVMQIPVIHNSGTPYAWLSFFQIIRIYRVVMAVPLTRNLIRTVLGNFTGLLNLIAFVFLINFLAAILAAQLFRGALPSQDSSGNTIRVQFFSMWNSFLGMYQVFSSENWTAIMYSLTEYNISYHTAWVAATFLILWFIVANFITLNMFIAIIQENFDISEDKKRLKQIENYIEQQEHSNAHGNMSLSNIIRQGLVGLNKRTQGPSKNATTDLLLKEAIMNEFLHQKDETEVSTPDTIQVGKKNVQMDADNVPTQPIRPAPGLVRSGTISSVWTTLVAKFKGQEPNPFYTRINVSRINDENNTSNIKMQAFEHARDMVRQQRDRERSQREYLRKHPNYNVSMYIFNPHNRLRRWCQMVVGPGRGGDRIEGVQPSGPIWYGFSAFIYACVVAMVLIACITTPLYQKQYFEKHTTKQTLMNWLTFTDVGFAVVFTVEAAIKVIADGVFWTPHAYYRSSWGFIDGIVLITLWVSVIGSFFNDADVSRSVGALKALRALRLLNISDRARDNFHSVIVRGAPKIVGAAFVSMSLLVPFAIFGLNLFLDKMIQCNDGNSNIDDLNNCWGEYATNSPFNWNVYAPRVAANSYFSFDNFGASLSILFQIVSQEGWIDVMFASQSIVGRFRQPQPFATEGNAVFFVIFNLLGSVFVLTLFVSVFMRNYTEMTGVAFLTTEQRSWLELRKRLYQISPSKRGPNLDQLPTWKLRIYRMAVTKSGKKGRWHRFVTAVLILHLIMLCTEFDPAPQWWDDTRDGIFLLFTVIIGINIFIRIVGLGWPRFRKSSWDLYSLAAVAGTGISTILVLVQTNNMVFSRIQRLFLVSIAFLLIPRNNQLDQLFKTAAASLPLITNLLATWFVLFLIFAIAMTQAFALTKFGSQGQGNLNLRNVPKALILLFRMSVGEGWNQIMQDYTVSEPFCTSGNGDALMSDCGSPTWARFLFIAWNILSMYLFVNLFISLIYESFSYVYQVSSGLRIITREEIRRFKEAWSVVDPDGTGFIPRSSQSLARVLGELGGVFDMRIYPEEYNVRKLLEDCATIPARPGTTQTVEPGIQHRATSWSLHPDESYIFRPKVQDVDITELNARLANLPIHEVRQRRNRLNLFWEEIMSRADRERGIGFTDLLLALTHYKVINDNKSLQLPEWLRRKQRLVLIEQEVRRQIVMRFFEAYQHRKRFRKHQERVRAGRIATVAAPKFEFAVPEIFVEDEDVQRRESEDRRRQETERLRQQLHQQSGIEDQPFSDSSPGVSGIPTPSAASAPSSPRSEFSRDSIQVSPIASPLMRPAALGTQQGRSPPHLTPQFLPASSSHLHQRSHSGDSSGAGSWRPSFDANVPPLDITGVNQQANARSRANSAVSVQDVLEQLDQSAWGESLRRSMSMGRRSPSRNRGERRQDREES